MSGRRKTKRANPRRTSVHDTVRSLSLDIELVTMHPLVTEHNGAAECGVAINQELPARHTLRHPADRIIMWEPQPLTRIKIDQGVITGSDAPFLSLPADHEIVDEMRRSGAQALSTEPDELYLVEVYPEHDVGRHFGLQFSLLEHGGVLRDAGSDLVLTMVATIDGVPMCTQCDGHITSNILNFDSDDRDDDVVCLVTHGNDLRLIRFARIPVAQDIEDIDGRCDMSMLGVIDVRVFYGRLVSHNPKSSGDSRDDGSSVSTTTTTTTTTVPSAGGNIRRYVVKQSECDTLGTICADMTQFAGSHLTEQSTSILDVEHLGQLKSVRFIYGDKPRIYHELRQRVPELAAILGIHRPLIAQSVGGVDELEIKSEEDPTSTDDHGPPHRAHKRQRR